MPCTICRKPGHNKRSCLQGKIPLPQVVRIRWNPDLCTHPFLSRLLNQPLDMEHIRRSYCASFVHTMSDS